MAHKIARLLLEQAKTFLGRKEAIRSAMSLGMPLDQIESYLDWLDMVQGDAMDEDLKNVEDATTEGSIRDSNQQGTPED